MNRMTWNSACSEGSSWEMSTQNYVKMASPVLIWEASAQDLRDIQCSLVNFENKPLVKKTFFLCHNQIYQNIIFSPTVSEIFIPLFNLAKILIFRSKFKNKPPMKRNFFLCRTEIYPSIRPFPIFRNFSFPSSNFCRILTFLLFYRVQLVRTHPLRLAS